MRKARSSIFGADVKTLVIALLVLAVLGLGMVIGAKEISHNETIAHLADAQAEVVVVKNKLQTAEKIAEDIILKNQDLINQVAALETKVEDLELIIETQSNMTPRERVKIVEVPINVPADPYLFEMNNGLVVAELGVLPGEETTQYEYKTYEINIETTVVSTETKTSISTFGSTGYDPEYRVQLEQHDLNVVKPVDAAHKLVDVDLALGVTGVVGLRPEVGASLSMPWLHPTPVIDTLTPRLTGTSSTFLVGLDVISYNVGEPLPVFENLWISAGPSISHRGEWSGAITIGAKL